MRESGSQRAPVQGLALAAAHRLAARANYPDNVGVCLLGAERQWGLGFTRLFRPWHSPMAPYAPADGRVASTPCSLKLRVAEPSPPENYPGALRSPGWRDGVYPGFFFFFPPFTPGCVPSS